MCYHTNTRDDAFEATMQSITDPVTKAVVDNIMGNLPTKKPLVRCHDCDLCFTSETVLDAHLQGARHAKQIRSKVIMENLGGTKIGLSKDQEASGLKCNVCNVSLNSIQQLQTHLNGNRHKKKAEKGGWTGNETVKAVQQQPKTPAPADSTTPAATKKKGEILTCEQCNKFFNSKQQYDVHITSKKHLHKVYKPILKTTNKKKRYVPYGKQQQQQYQQPQHQQQQHHHQQHQQHQQHQYQPQRSMQPYDTTSYVIPSLANNFISGGYTSNY
ncbi:zinc finger protein 385A-like isoform X1 [Microplitis mediator]|uniref:zinc finger protein 385A-like isoform X1 n=2 Tax=Microplitis mediator TaxID=375433 RepID=UPI002557BD03|nr:zinc finger protein 385A-like isoform X1 [Microplitis mediator]